MAKKSSQSGKSDAGGPKSRPRVIRGRVNQNGRTDAGGRRHRYRVERPSPPARKYDKGGRHTRIQPKPKEFAITGKLNDMPIAPLNIQGYGKLAFPIYSEDVLGSLRKVMTKSKFGLDAKDVYDKNVRVSWELKADKISFANPAWERYLKYRVMPNIITKLGCGQTTTLAVLDKFLIYEKGSFFLKHIDKVKEPGNFGTLVIQLPSDYCGGNLVCEHKKMNKMIVDHSSGDGNFEKQFNGFYTAFYTNVEHEVTKVISGIRSCLVYKLVDTSKRNAAKSKTPQSRSRSRSRIRRPIHHKGPRD